MASYSIRQLADRWQTSERTIRRMIGAGKLTAFKVGTGTQRDAIRIHADSVRSIETPEATIDATSKSRSLTPRKRWV